MSTKRPARSPMDEEVVSPVDADASITAAMVDLMPAIGGQLGGYQRARPSTGIHRRLEANAIVIRTRDSQLALVSIDALAITSTLRGTVARAVSQAQYLPESSVLVVATHTHSAPAAWVGTIMPALPAVVDAAECQRIADLIAGALSTAQTTPFPMFGTGEGLVSGVGSNRNDPAVAVDSSAGVSVFLEARGDVACVMFDYACHATVLGPENLALSPDWVGSARETIRAALGGPSTPVLYFPGAGGNVSARHCRRERSCHEADRLGAVVGRAAVQAARQSSPTPLRELIVESVPLRARPREPLPLDLLPESARPEHRDLAQAIEADPPILGRSTAVRLNESGTLFVPFELTSELGESIRDAREGTRIASCADGYLGYLASADDHGAGLYEAEVSFFSPEETDRLLDQLRRVAIRAS